MDENRHLAALLTEPMPSWALALATIFQSDTVNATSLQGFGWPVSEDSQPFGCKMSDFGFGERGTHKNSVTALGLGAI